MVSLACAIILMHAVVPHHHDDCCGEVECFFCSEHHHDHCCHHDGDSHHPFDICKIQEMLSHLVLTTRDDEAQLAEMIVAEAHCFLELALPGSPDCMPAVFLPIEQIRRLDQPAPIHLAPAEGAMTLRAPPAA